MLNIVTKNSLTNGMPNLLCLDAELKYLTTNGMYIPQLLVPNGQWDLVA